MGEDWLCEVLDGYRDNDDVFGQEYMHLVVIYTRATMGCGVTQTGQMLLKAFGTDYILTVKIPRIDEHTILGPALLKADGLYDVHKLVHDTHKALMVSFIPREYE